MASRDYFVNRLLACMTHEELKYYQPIWGDFTHFSYTFGGQRTFGFYGELSVSNAGEIRLNDLLVTYSREYEPGEFAESVQQLHQAMENFAWHPQAESDSTFVGKRQKFRLYLRTTPTPDKTIVTHVYLAYGNGEKYIEHYHQRCFLLRSQYPEQPGPERNRFYPIQNSPDPSAVQEISVSELANFLCGKRIVVFTGAGISISSGIPSFRGSAGLDSRIPLHEDFPGHATWLMVEHPEKIARIVSDFQANFIRAKPNAAHKALAELEHRGVLVELITGNADRLHERAGSQRVHLKESKYFVDSDEGWNWIRSGDVFLVIGVSQDEHGFLCYARVQGIQIVLIALEPPDFLHPGDWYILGKAEEILPQLCQY